MRGRRAGFRACGGYFNIFLNGAAKSADSSIFDDLCYLFHRFKITGAGNGETGFDDINTEVFQLKGQLDLFSWC